MRIADQNTFRPFIFVTPPYNYLCSNDTPSAIYNQSGSSFAAKAGDEVIKISRVMSEVEFYGALVSSGVALVWLAQTGLFVNFVLWINRAPLEYQILTLVKAGYRKRSLRR